MSNEELKARLKDLHHELEQAQTLSLEERDKFGSLMSDMVLIGPSLFIKEVLFP